MKPHDTNLSKTTHNTVLAALLACALAGKLSADEAPGQVDATFRPALDARVTHLVRQADGQVLIAGLFSTINGVSQALLARLTPSGALDLSFRPQVGGAEISALGVGPDGRIVVAGDFTIINGLPRQFIARLHPDGRIDETFDAGAGLAVAPPGYSFVFVRTLLVQEDHRIVIGGAMTVVHGVTNRGMARLNVDGSLDTSFNSGGGLSVPGTRPEVYQILQQGEGILVGGIFEQYRGVRTPGLVRIFSNGDPDTNFVGRLPLTVNAVYDLEIVAGGQLLVMTPLAAGRKGAVKLNADGSLEPQFDPGNALPTGIVLQAGPGQPDGKVYVHSYLSRELLRLNLDGSLDSTFLRGPGYQTGLGAAILTDDQRLLVGGTFTTAQGLDQPYLARVETGLGPPAPDVIQLIDVPTTVAEDAGSSEFHVQRTGTGQGAASVRYRVLSGTAQVGQDFAAAEGVLQWADGELSDRAFTVSLLDDSLVEGDEDFIVELDEPQGAVLGSRARAGVTLSDNECPANARDGSFDGFLTVGGTFPNAYALATFPDDRVVVGGAFNAIDGHPAGLARLTAEGELDTGFNTQLNGRVDALGPLPDGRLMAAGTFNQVNQTAVRNLVRLQSDGSVDTSFVPSLPDGTWLTALAVEPGNSMVVGGANLAGSGSASVYIERVTAFGAIDPTFVPPNLGYGGVRALRLQHDGRIVVAAQTYDGIPGLVRLQTNGVLDTSFHPPHSIAGYSVTAVSLLPDDRMVIAVSALSEAVVMRLLANGALDPDFQPAHVRGSPFGAFVHAILVEATGSVVLAGSFGSVDGIPALGIARLDATGHADNSLMGQGVTHESGIIYTLAGQSSGAVIVGGGFTEFNNLPCSGLARLLPLTPSDNTLEFASARFVGREAEQRAVITVRRCGDSRRPITARIVVAGGTATEGADFVRLPTQLHFAATEISKNIEMEVIDDNIREADETIELRLERVSDSAFIGPQSVAVVTLLENDLAPSNLDPSFALDYRFHALQPDGKLLASVSRFLYRLDSNLPTDEMIAIDPSFQPVPMSRPDGGAACVRVVPQPDGKILIGGLFTYPGPGYVRVLPNGEVDGLFMSNATAQVTVAGVGVHAIVLQPDGRILLATANSSAGQGVVRVDADGRLDTTFRASVGFNSSFGGFHGIPSCALALQTDGRVLIGGDIGNVNGSRRDGLARLHADGSLDESFAPVITGGGLVTAGVKALAVQSDGRILIGGDFAFVNGVRVRNLARLNRDGSLDTAFGIGGAADGFVYDLLIEVDGRIMVGGSFTHLKGTRRTAVGRLQTDGSIDVEVAPVLPPFSQVLTLGHARNGLTYLGGQFCDLDPVDCEDDDCDSCVHTLRLLPERSPRVVRLTQTTANQVQLQLRCLPEQSCVLEVSPDLLQWTPLSTNLAAGEIMDCFDGAASGWPQRFYRVRVASE